MGESALSLCLQIARLKSEKSNAVTNVDRELSFLLQMLAVTLQRDNARLILRHIRPLRCTMMIPDIVQADRSDFANDNGYERSDDMGAEP